MFPRRCLASPLFHFAFGRTESHDEGHANRQAANGDRLVITNQNAWDLFPEKHTGLRPETM